MRRLYHGQPEHHQGVLEKWELSPLLATPVLLLALLVAGIALAWLLRRRVSR